ncbi:MAG: LLM class flavin-dependent oxidoreductase [Phenylobacterium sp.]|uniref:LLM class flavin-dependent oxidoreductase n=1 Tax=Phenylobacterium sp. TaxID=1871053 RepID=UPI002734BB84|nr:LLM class flavin-dependent oxidoreductase [Phenylobacterium sp.]MDP3176054.1 LLM class flavin-dependent oxidoreductase [Phenylobacterium sp.]
MTTFSVLDLSPIVEGGGVAQSLRNTLDLAQHAERWGFHRYWVAEHHNMPGIASAATSVVIGHVGAGTKTIRVGAGGIMLPNHAPLQIAEQFGTLEALFPGRVDLGLGRAPGTDQVTAHALRRTLASDPNDFPRDVVELMHYLQPAEPGRRVRAFPGEGADIEIWILGSSLFGAQLAAMLGLPFAFASHFAPAQMMEAIQIYRSRFTPSDRLDKPYLMLGVSVVAADADDQAKLIASSQQQAFVRMRTGQPGPLPPPVEGYIDKIGPAEKGLLAEVLSRSIVGSPAVVEAGLKAFIERTGAEELMITSQVFDHTARLRSYELVGEMRARL